MLTGKVDRVAKPCRLSASAREQVMEGAGVPTEVEPLGRASAILLVIGNSVPGGASFCSCREIDVALAGLQSRIQAFCYRDVEVRKRGVKFGWSTRCKIILQFVIV